jgi:hypothetical protein
MKRPLDPTPPVNSEYGAPMGRPAHDTFTDTLGQMFKMVVNADAAPFRLVHCPLDRGGYDRGGAYWGIGEPLYYYEGPLSDINGYVRGRTRDRAKDAVRAIHPSARFYR